MAKPVNKSGWVQYRLLVTLAVADCYKLTGDGKYIRGLTMPELARETGMPYDSCRKSLPALIRDGWALKFPWVIEDRCGWVYLLSKRGSQFLQLNGRTLQEIAAAGLLSQVSVDSILRGGDGE